MTATETETRNCKGCANFALAANAPGWTAEYQRYLEAMATYNAWQDGEGKKGFWASLLSLGTPYHLRPRPPYPMSNPEHFGWCRLNPTAVEKSVGSWCSHFSSSHGREGAE